MFRGKTRVTAAIIPGKRFTVPSLQFLSLPPASSSGSPPVCSYPQDNIEKITFQLHFTFLMKRQKNHNHRIFLKIFELNHLHTLRRCLTTLNHLNLIFCLCISKHYFTERPSSSVGLPFLCWWMCCLFLILLQSCKI